MIYFIKKLFILIITASLISNSHAENILYESDTAYLSTSLTLQSAFFTQSNSWFGNAQNNIGHNDSSWWEAWIEPGLKGHVNLKSDSQLYSELSYIYAKTFGDDASGLTLGLDNPGKGKLEQAYIGWRSGQTFALANNLLDISLGQQDYKLGHGFLLWGSGSSGFKNGAWWLGGRHAFADSGVIKINTGSIKADTFRLKTRPQTGNAKDMRGVNFEYLPNKDYTLGFSYIKVKQEDKLSIDGADIFDFRLDINKLSILPGFSFLGEYVKEDNGIALDSQGWYTDFTYKFKQLNWQPQLSYRYASFEGDDPDTLKNEAFDPLRYGFPDWGAWYQGEIIGEYVLGNSNLNSHLLRIKTKPHTDLTLNLLYFQFFSDQPQSRGINSKHFADEINLISDWSITKSFSISGVLAIAMPGEGAKEMTSGNENWVLAMLYAYYKF
ncbi:MAG: hypothetical protein QM504_15105 [Pseudomonadota bacterium]